MHRRLVVLAVFATLVAAACGGGGGGSAAPLPEELVFAEEPVIVIDPPVGVAVDYDGDGFETISFDASGSIDQDGTVQGYQWSEGLDVISNESTLEAEFPVGENVLALSITDNDGQSDVQAVVARVLDPYERSSDTAPEIEIWVGEDQRIDVGGGEAQRWVDIPGRVTDGSATVDPETYTLTYSFNGGLPETLRLGPDSRRLVNNGDFNLDILRTALREGRNTVELRATDDQGEFATALIEITDGGAPVDPFPVVLDWAEKPTFGGLLEIVDGHWQWKEGEIGVGADAFGYDRLLAIGDHKTWRDYEVRTQFVVDRVAEPTEISPFSTNPGIGLLLRWNGHNESIPGFQPQAGFRSDGGVTLSPFGAFVLYSFGEDEGRFVKKALEIQDHNGVLVDSDDQPVAVNEGSIYNLAAQAQTVTGGGTVYQAKIWPKDEGEPPWQLTFVADRGDNQPASGSVVLLAHEVEARFFETRIEPIRPEDELTAEQVDQFRTGFG